MAVIDMNSECSSEAPEIWLITYANIIADTQDYDATKWWLRVQFSLPVFPVSAF